VCYFLLSRKATAPSMLSDRIKCVRVLPPDLPVILHHDFGNAVGSTLSDRIHSGKMNYEAMMAEIGHVSDYVAFTAADSPVYWDHAYVYRYGPYSAGDMVVSSIPDLQFVAIGSELEGTTLTRTPFMKALTKVDTFVAFCGKFVTEMQARVQTYFNPLRVTSEFASCVVGVPKTIKFNYVDGKAELDTSFLEPAQNQSVVDLDGELKDVVTTTTTDTAVTTTTTAMSGIAMWAPTTVAMPASLSGRNSPLAASQPPPSPPPQQPPPPQPITPVPPQVTDVELDDD